MYLYIMTYTINHTHTHNMYIYIYIPFVDPVPLYLGFLPPIFRWSENSQSVYPSTIGLGWDRSTRTDFGGEQEEGLLIASGYD